MSDVLRRGLAIGLLLLLSGCQPAPPQAKFVQQIEWIDKGHWVKADLHAHTKFSDGAHSIAEVVDQAAKFGCGAVAVTDHGDHNLTAATKPYFEEIEAARKAHPEMLILAGLEWNVPPHNGVEHAKLLMPTSAREGQLLAEFKAAFDDYKRDDHPPEHAAQALRWLNEHAVVDGVAPVVIYNHPNRKRDESSGFVEEFEQLRKVNGLVVGFEGAPGHQRAKPLGSYKKKQELVDRWDPAVANVGDAWDQLLAKGLDVWGAEASSDFHNANPEDLHDYWPGEFSETWLYVPEKSAAGVLRALQAGSFFGVHGHIAREARLQVLATGLPRPAEAGETISIPPGFEIEVSVSYQPAPSDWEGKPSALHSLELIAIDETGAKEIASHLIGDGPSPLRVTLKPTSKKSTVLRARGRRVVDDGPDLMFYTNPVRVLVDQKD